jgi:hypothetical protein
MKRCPQLARLAAKAQEESPMKAIMLMTGSGPIVILTSYPSPTAPGLLEKLQGKGINKFVAYELPLALAKERYGKHFTVVEHDLRESDDLRVLDYDGSRAFHLFRFSELSAPTAYEPEAKSNG